MTATARAARLSTALILVGAVLNTPMQAHAAIRCIENEAQFKPTFDSALASGNAVEEIRIKQGLYLFTNGSSGYFGVVEGSGKTLSIRGGWRGSPGACTIQDGAALTTILSGNGQRPVFGIMASATFTGSVTVENLLITGGRTTVGSTPAALQLSEQNGGVMRILVDRVWIEGNVVNSGVSAPAVRLSSRSGLVLRNSVIAGNSSGVSPPVIIQALAGQSNYVLNNTIAFNTTAHAMGYAGLFSGTSNSASLVLANNLFDGNIATTGARFDIHVNTSGISLQNNRFTGLSGTPDAQSGSSSGPAGFAEFGYGLDANSPARDAGAYFAPLIQGSLDAAAGQRVRGVAVDLGALEHSAIFSDGFE